MTSSGEDPDNRKAEPAPGAGQTAPSQPESQVTTDEPGVDPRLLELLVCPLTRTILIYDREQNELISRAAGLAYPIQNGVPLMTADAARELTEADRERLKRRR